MAAELATSLDASQADRLEQAEAVVRAHCGWHVAPVRSVELDLDGPGGPALLLPTLRLIDVESITEDDTTLDPEDWWWSTTGVIHRAKPYVWTGRRIRVRFTHGYAEVPAEVTGVVQAVARRAVENPGSRPRAQVGPFADSFSQVGFNQAPALALLDAERHLLAPYTIPPSS